MAVSNILYEDNRRFLWGLCYRMTGNAADAEDIVQEVFVKAMGNTSLDTERPLRPWLVRRTSEKNLGTIFTFWDRMRGTLTLVETDEKSVFGNGETAYPQSWPAQLIEPVLRITRTRRASYQ